MVLLKHHRSFLLCVKGNDMMFCRISQMILGTGTKGICSSYYKGEVGLGALRHTRGGVSVGLDKVGGAANWFRSTDSCN